jgi:PKD repeat protein
MRKFFTLFLSIATILLWGQSLTLKPISTNVDPLTQLHLNRFDVLLLDPATLQQAIDDIPGNVKRITLRTPRQSWQLELFEYSLLSPNAVRNSTDPRQPTHLPARKDFRTFKGHLAGQINSLVSMSLADGFLKLMVDDRGERYFVEPVNKASLSEQFPASHQYFLYRQSDVVPVKGVSCGADVLNERLQEGQRHMEEKNKELNYRSARCPKCVEVQIALAADITMFNKYGSVAGAENQMLSILADVQTVFDNEFEHQYEYQVTGTYVADDVQRDPWAGIRDIFEQLEVFSQVGITIFSGTSYEVATNWTDKFRTGVIGVAYLSQVCNLQPYNVCSDYIAAGGRQGNYLTLQAHELGHNWSMFHDAEISPTIMAPVINGSAHWSATSVFSLNNYVNINSLIESGCLSICPGSDAPTVDFSADVTYGCQPLTVRFKDLSTFVDKWEWSFPGGTPSSSTLQNPVVVYRVPGTWEVTLKASNSRCEASEVKIGYIEVNDKPVAGFSYGNNGREVFFIDQSVRADSYFWDFGDGNTSEDANPYHVYDYDTTYTVTMRVVNDCGTHVVKKQISIVSIPIADFEADTTGGCAPRFIKFFDRSTNNVRRWEWSFPGGTPSVSLSANPVVRYDLPGVYDVRLTVYASRYHHGLTKTMYITIDSLPDASFDFTSIGNVVDFTNTTRYGKAHFWDFGDGTTSTAPNPSHTYAQGRFEVTYISSNGCGSDTAYSQLTIGEKPVAGFQVEERKGCLPYTVRFQNQSTAAATDFRWYFPGGNPATSIERDPLVTYNSIGAFDVSLVASNPLFNDSIGLPGFIEVNDLPEAAFANAIAGFKASFINQAQRASNYFWDFGDSQISFDKDPEHEYGAEGEFDVRLVVQNECGWDTFDKKIAVYLIPKVNYAADTLRGCAPLDVQFFDRSSIDVISWDWQFESGNPSISSDKNPKVRFDKKGKYTVKLTVRNTNGTNALTRLQYVEVLSPVLCPEYPEIGIGEFGHDQDEQESRSAWSDDQERANGDYLPRVLPNPVRDRLTVWSWSEPNNPAALELFDFSGRVRQSLRLEREVHVLGLQDLEPGNYFVRVTSKLGTSVHKIAVVR